jgi:hypothetical protein
MPVLLLSISFGCSEVQKPETGTPLDAPITVIEEKKEFSPEEQNKVIGNITFDTSEEDFNKEVANIGDANNNIGNFHFLNILPSFHQGSLYSLVIDGSRVKPVDYERRISSDVRELTDMLTAQYGEPVIYREMPERHDITNPVKMWEVGPKYININIEEDRQGYNFVTLEIYHGARHLEAVNAYRAENDSISNTAKDIF